MKSLDKNLAFLFGVIIVLLVALFYGETKFPMDGQIFQVVAGLLTAAGATFFSAARHTFGIPDDKPDGSVTTKISRETTVTQIPPPPPPAKDAEESTKGQ